MKVFKKPSSAEYVEYRRGEDVSLVNLLNSLATLMNRLEELEVLKLYNSLLLSFQNLILNKVYLDTWLDTLK